MSKRQKRQFRWATFTIFPVLLLIAALVPVYLSVTSPAEALTGAEWTKVQGYVDAYITGQYLAGNDGEAGFVTDAAAVKSRVDSNGDMNLTTAAGTLGEGDDAANAPVLVDVLVSTANVIPGTSARCLWNGAAGTGCLESAQVTTIKNRVDAHVAAGFSTDVIAYCATGHTEAPATGGLAYVAQTPNGLGTGVTPNVKAFKWGRNGWQNTTKTYSNANVTVTPGSTSTYSAATNPTNCDGVTPDSELVRCTALWALTTGAISNGVNPPLSNYQVVDLRPGTIAAAPAPGGTVNGGLSPSIQVPINTVFNTGLANLNPDPGAAGGTEKLLFVNRTQHTAGIVGMGARMLGYQAAFLQWGLPNYNNTMDEKWVSSGVAYPVVTATVNNLTSGIDITAPTITVAPSAGSITATTATISRTANEPATMKVEYGTSPGVYTTTVNNTVLNAAKSVNLTGLSSYTTYYVRVTSYDGQANGTASTEFSFQTLDSTNPSVSNFTPTDGTTLNNVTSYTFGADLSDTGSGINAGASMIHLDTGNMLMDCPVMTTTRIECNAMAGDLGLGAHTLDVYAEDNAGNGIWAHANFTVADTIAPSVTYTGPSGNTNDNTPSVTGTYTDPAPSSGIASATLSLDSGGTFPYTCVAAAGTVTCNVTPAVADGLKNAVIRVTDGSSNSGTASGSFTVDTSLPVISGVLPSGWITTANPATVSATLSDTGSGINTAAGSIAVDGTPLGSCTVGATSISCNTSAANFAQGAHTILVTAYDLAGNSQTGGGSFSVDSAAPTVSNIQPSGAIGTNSTTVTADYSDLTSGINQATVAVTLDTVTMTGCTAGAGSVSCPATGLADGPHAIAVTVNDVAGNTGSGNGSFTVDTAAPTVTPDALGYQPGNWTADTTPTVSATISGVPGGQNITAATVVFDQGTGSAYTCSGGEITFNNTSVSCTPGTARSAGSHTVDFSAEYSLGHPGSGTSTINIDTTAPSVTSVLPSDNITVTSTTISGNYSDGGSGINSTTATIALDGGAALTGCTATGTGISCPATGLTQGAHTIAVSVNDNTGTTGTGNGSFTVDTIAPSVTNLSPSGFVTSASPTVSGDYSDSGTGIDSGTAQITVDGSALTGCTATGTGISCPTSGLSDGLHNYTVSVNDTAGNPGSSSGSFTVDTTAPTATSILPSGIISSSSTTVTANLSDTNGVNAASVVVNLDGSPLAGCTITATTASCPATGLAEGAHTIAINMNDNATNPGTGNGSFTVDTNTPSVTNLSPSGDITTSSPTITADFADIGGTGIDASTAAVTLDGNPVAGCSATTSGISCTATVTSGVHNYTVSVDDMAGNTGSSSSSFTLTQQNYYFPWYDNKAANSMKGDWLMISNLGGATAEVKIYIGDISDAATPVAQYSVAGGNAIAPNGQVSWFSPTPLADGPVRVVSTNGQTLLVSQRVLYKDSFNEVMAATAADVAETEFDFTWYDNDPANGMGGNWIMVANADPTASATADVYIHGAAATTLTIPAGGYQVWHAPVIPVPVTDGPVQVMSRSGQKLIVSQRVVYGSSFTEVIASGRSTLQDEGLFTWYDNDPANGMNGNWVMAANMGNTATDIEIYVTDIGGGATPEKTFTGVLPGQTVAWPSPQIITSGPVRVRSSNAQPLMTSQRVVYKSSLEEVQGLTPNQMGTNADFNWYDWQSAGMNGDWILIGNQNASGKDMGITIASTAMVNAGTGTANFPVGANASVAPSFAGLMNGPVRTTCSSCSPGDKLIISQRVLYKDSFNEVVGRPRPAS